MYLTEDEFKVLSGIKEGLSHTEIKEKYGVQMYTNDPRISSLAKKYGVDIHCGNIRKGLIEKADMSKVEVVSKDEMPYFKYIDFELADYIDLCKRDVEKLSEYFKNRPDNEYHTHRLWRTEDGLGTTLGIQDLATGEITKLHTFIDGCEMI